MRIEGHTDSTGSITTNLVLSQRRAEAVADTLVAAGVVDAIASSPTGLGPDFPVASNATAAGRQQNRRVEVVIENAPVSTGSAMTHVAGDQPAHQALAFTQAPFFRLNSTTASMNFTPATPSSTVGTSVAAGSGGRPSSLAQINSAASL